MERLIFPPFEYKTRRDRNNNLIFDVLRKKYVVLTPEEWVRQHLIHFLIDILKYPKALITVEDSLNYNKLQKRSDVAVYEKSGKVFMVIECKSTKIQLNQKSFDQLAIYNQHYKAKYLTITNGLRYFICQMDYENKRYEFIENFPSYNSEGSL